MIALSLAGALFEIAPEELLEDEPPEPQAATMAAITKTLANRMSIRLFTV